MSAPIDPPVNLLVELDIASIDPNLGNPRLDFPQDELERLMDSIDQEGVLVPIVVYQSGERYVLVDGERRFRSARDLGLSKIPALVTAERSEREVLQQMFNIHLIREPWRDIPTAKALQRLSEDMKSETGEEPSDADMRDLTGLAIERVRQLRYVVTLPDEWQEYIRTGRVPLNYFWELKKNVIDALRNNRPQLFNEFGEQALGSSFVQKRLDGVVTDTVGLRNVSPIIKFAARDAEENGTGASQLDETIRDLIVRPEATIDDAYEETVQLMVEVGKLGRRTASMLSIFARLLLQTAGSEEQSTVRDLGRGLVDGLQKLLAEDGADGGR